MQFFRANNSIHPLFNGGRASATIGNGTACSGPKTVGRWLKDRREKKKEETRTHTAQLHATISVAAVAAAVAAIAAATAGSSAPSKDEKMAKTDMAVASAATLVAAQCVEAAEAMGAERDHLASVVSSAVNVRSHDDITTLTAAAATGRAFALIKHLFLIYFSEQEIMKAIRFYFTKVDIHTKMHLKDLSNMLWGLNHKK